MLKILNEGFQKIINNHKFNVLMSNNDIPAIIESINSQSQNIPQIHMPLKRLTRARSLSANEYMSKQLLEAILTHIDFTNKENVIYFEDFAKELIWFQLRGDKYKVLGSKNTFIIHNITCDFEYKCTFY